MKKIKDLVAVIITIMIIIPTIVYIFLDEKFASYSVIIISVFASLAASLTLSMFLRIFKSNPTSITVSILGYPSTGKTVYLTVLLNEILTNYSAKVPLKVFGQDTIERIASDYKILRSGNWLPPTPTYDVKTPTFDEFNKAELYSEFSGIFFYRLFAYLSSYKKYKIEIGDYAGEKFKNELIMNNNFIHKTNYFKYVQSSDIVFLAVDLQRVVNEDIEYIIDIQNSFITTLQIMHESRNINIRSKISFPVALVFLKSDCLLPCFNKLLRDHDFVIEKFNRVIHYCKKNCKSFSYFFVSSIGNISIEDAKKTDLKPQNVIDPILWAIKELR